MRVRRCPELRWLRCCQSLFSGLCLVPGLELPGAQCLYLGAGRGGLCLSPVLFLCRCGRSLLVLCFAVLTQRERCSSSEPAACWRPSGSAQPATRPGTAPPGARLPRGPPLCSVSQRHSLQKWSPTLRAQAGCRQTKESQFVLRSMGVNSNILLDSFSDFSLALVWVASWSALLAAEPPKSFFLSVL